ncbi:MAG: hypothetical protein ACRDLB_05115 [Actinomycetota bacterium]
MRRLLASLLAAGLVLGACGGDSGGDGPDPAEDPKGALTSAFENLGEWAGVDATLSLDTEADDLVAVSEGDLTEEQADTIVNSAVNLKAVGADNPEDAQVEFVLDIDGSLAEMRVLNNVIYARADVRDLVDKFGGDQAEVDAAVQQMSGQFDFIQPLVDGEWVGFEGAEQLTQQFGAPSPDAELQQRLTNDLAQAVEDNSTVTEEGSDDAGTHLVANLQIKPLYEALQESFAGLSQVPGTDLPSSAEVPDEEIAVDFWVDDGNLTQIGFDFMQVAELEDSSEIPEGVDQLGILLELAEFDDSIEEPDAATTVNLQELMGGLMGGLGGTETGGSSSEEVELGEDICEQLAEQPPEVQQQFVEQCPEFAQ